MAIETPYNLSPTDQILAFEPTERGILWIIAHNPTAFTAETYIDLFKNPQVFNSNHPNYNLSKALPIYMKLHKRGFIRDGKKTMKTVVTWRGQFYRFYTNPLVTFWGTIIALLIGITTLIVSVLVLLSTEKYKSPPETIKAILLPTGDSPLYHQKKDTSLSKQVILPTSKKAKTKKLH